MNSRSDTTSRLLGYGWLPWVVIALILATFGGTVFVVTRHFQMKIRDQIIAREGEVLHSVAVMQHGADGEAAPAYSLAEPASQLNLLLKVSRLKGVMGARLFTSAGQLVTAFPEYVADGGLQADDLRQLQQLKPISRFFPEALLSHWFLSVPRELRAQTQTAPLVEVIVPIHELNQARLLGAAQFLIDGRVVAAELGALEKVLLLQPAVLLVVGGAIIVGGLGWAFHRLRRQSASLLQANLELALAAKTSAVGAITAHLIHGLKSPLFGLQSIMAGRQTAEAGRSDPALQTALDTTRRMHAMLNRVVDVLRDEAGLAQEEVSLEDLARMVEDKMAAPAREAGVQLAVDLETTGMIPARAANLVLLIFVNLMQNAIEATPRGKSVRLTMNREGGQILCAVADEGGGVPVGMVEGLFTPCESTKPGGSGIGLTISKQLANHLGARLELQSTSPRGSVFLLGLPARLLTDQTLLAVLSL